MICGFLCLPSFEKRNDITREVSRINKEYPGADERAFIKAQRNIQNYMFSENESVKILNLEEDVKS